MDTPIGKDGRVACNEEYLNMLIKIANSITRRSKKKIKRLEKNLKKNSKI